MPKAQFHYLLNALTLCFCLCTAVHVRAADSVAAENAKPGTTLWQLTSPASMFGVNSTNPADYAGAEIQGYASRTSVNQGESIDFFVRTINTNSYNLSGPLGSSTGTVGLNGPAPAGGARVTLSSSNPSVASVPSSVTVAAGATSATFTVRTSVVFTTSSVAIAASFGATRSATLTVRPAVPLL